MRSRYFYGIHLKIESGGSFSYWNSEAIFALIANAIVYMTLPTMILKMVTRYMLGPLSSVYHKAQIQKVELIDIFAGYLLQKHVCVERGSVDAADPVPDHITPSRPTPGDAEGFPKPTM